MNKPNLPEELDLFAGTKEYSLRTDMKVNGWGYAAMILSFAGDVLLPRHPEWHPAARTLIALAPILPALLWGRVFARWIRGMDELHRRITVEACLFATTATLFLFTALHPLGKAGLLEALAHQVGLDLRTWWGTSWLLVCFYLVGTRILNRRYQ
jgi:hypothetical protein